MGLLEERDSILQDKKTPPLRPFRNTQNNNILESQTETHKPRPGSFLANRASRNQTLIQAKDNRRR
ncbi:MAG: hypothetical protein CL920_13205 [Deltaproteobacteria bacterium]|nr:hypothetical protein [Deltaproteobacteria bacterium]